LKCGTALLRKPLPEKIPEIPDAGNSHRYHHLPFTKKIRASNSLSLFGDCHFAGKGQAVLVASEAYEKKGP
jgi:hypothetical protein